MFKEKKVILISFIFCTLFIYFIVSNRPIKTPQHEIDMTGSTDILDFLDKLKKEDAIEEELAVKLDHILKKQSFRYMFLHYNRSIRPNELPETLFRDMILSLKFNDRYTLKMNKRADSMLPYWKKAYKDTSPYRKIAETLSLKTTQDKIQNSIDFANSWLPPSMQVPSSYIFFLAQGGSSAFVVPPGKIHKPSQGIDLFQLASKKGNFNLKDLLMMMAHESHHLGYLGYISQKKVSPLEMFLALTVAEGVANSVVNNLSKASGESLNFSLFPEKQSKEGLAEWKHYQAIKDDLLRKYLKDVDSLIVKYDEKKTHFWWGGKHKQRLYYIGVEATIEAYRTGGKKAIFELMKNPRLITKHMESILAGEEKK